MKREHEQLWKRLDDAGKTHKNHIFQVRHKLLETVSPVPGNVIERFICDPDSYEILSDAPNETVKKETKVSAKKEGQE